MSHHLDSPLARQDPRLNITDQYVFDDRDATVFVLNARTSLAGDAQPSGFHDDGRYEVKVHLDGAAREDLTFRIAFGWATDGVQPYQVVRLEGAAAADDAATGVEIARGRTGQTVQGPGGLRVWAGRALDPFALDLRQLAAVDRLVIHGMDADITAFRPGQASNTFAGSTVSSIVLRVPHTDHQLFPDRDIRVWSTTKLATDAGGWRQIGRAGLPMIWPIFRDADSETAGQANGTHPSEDGANYGKAIRELIAGAVRRRGTSARPDAYALEVTDRIVPDTLRYQIGTPAIFGFTDFNGRQLGDNAPEVMFSLTTNSAVSTGVTAEAHTGSFPYVIPT